ADWRGVRRGELVAAATVLPATSGRTTWPASTSLPGGSSERAPIGSAPHAGRWLPLPSPAGSPSPAVSARLSSAASVIARYNAPESRCAHPRRRATAAAVEDFPAAAGPSHDIKRMLTFSDYSAVSQTI